MSAKPSTLLAKYGPWALVTGASSGIGEAFARQLAAEGFNIVLTARRQAQLQALATELATKHGIEAEALGIDLSSENFIDELMAGIDDRDIGLVISNAGFGLKGEHHEQDPQQLKDMLHVNSLAPMLITQAITPHMIKRGKGGMLLTGSMEGFMGFPQSAGYSATKNFVHALGEALWQELKPYNIDVLTLAPGSTDTNALTSQGFDSSSMKGVMAPAEVAALGLRQLGKKRLHVAGAANNLFARLMSGLPRKWGLAMAEAGMKSALKK
jgi:short-subunit dehydrogenase